MKVTPERLAADLQSEFVIEHRAGGTTCTADYLAKFIKACTCAATGRQERRMMALMSAITRALARPTKKEADDILISIQAQVQAHALEDE